MAYHYTREEKQLLKLLKKLPFAEETRADWVKRIETSGMTEELADEIRVAFSNAGIGSSEGADLVQQAANVTRLIRQWRLAQQSKSFKKH